MAYWLMKSEPGSYSWDDWFVTAAPCGTGYATTPRDCIFEP